MEKTLKDELNRLIPDSGIETIHGKYYMRFELGGEGNKNNSKRIEQATFRGTEIVKQLIGKDKIIITIKQWKSDFFDPDNHNRSYLFEILNGSQLRTINGPFDQHYLETDKNGIKHKKNSEEQLDCDLIIGKVKLSIEQFTSIIKGIASLEMGEEPCIPQDVIFF